MSAALTARQQKVMDFVASFIAVKGFPPTRKDISDYFGFKSQNSASLHLEALRKKGRIEITSGVSRGIKIVTA